MDFTFERNFFTQPDLAIIEKVRCTRYMFNKDAYNYGDQSLKRQFFEKLSQELNQRYTPGWTNITAATVNNQWQHIKRKFSTVHGKYVFNMNSLSPEQQDVFDELKFLAPYCTHKNQVQEDVNADEEEDENDESFSSWEYKTYAALTIAARKRRETTKQKVVHVVLLSM
ncbi:uncharacterized protein LOC116416242 [Nasonia vitripennis]|uniref:MADF domain-containing protein n=1 Tax=Nasonia vitripennis TaxID=7425 RepID=A0A7M7Q0B1_NASVI|nr:uncharacterized protein LOC116416242 [Nasonia vitripennis]